MKCSNFILFIFRLGQRGFCDALFDKCFLIFSTIPGKGSQVLGPLCSQICSILIESSSYNYEDFKSFGKMKIILNLTRAFALVVIRCFLTETRFGFNLTLNLNFRQ